MLKRTLTLTAFGAAIVVASAQAWVSPNHTTYPTFRRSATLPGVQAKAFVAPSLAIQGPGGKTDHLVVAQNAFVALHVTPQGGLLGCGSNEVMIGIHLAQGRVICAALNLGYKVQVRYTDPSQGTHVGSNPVMHGCPQNFFIQAVHLSGPGQDESLAARGESLHGLLAARRGHG
jgi:hypothetical protein